MLRVLIEVFSPDTVVPNRGFPCERDVALKNLIGIAADPYVWAGAVTGLVALRCPLLLLKWPVAAKAAAWWTLTGIRRRSGWRVLGALGAVGTWPLLLVLPPVWALGWLVA